MEVTLEGRGEVGLGSVTGGRRLTAKYLGGGAGAGLRAGFGCLGEGGGCGLVLLG